ncbi:MAG: alpha-L-fucosidase [Ruminococcaceae bacterium]|nr:alpha-L-fucosidase [Oscillospiraceae bacterium]
MSIPVAKQYILDFEQMGLGMFIHWGLYSQLGRGEWVFNLEHYNMDEYKKLADTFTAEDFDAEKIVRTAKEAGFKYITFTTRHHEGFSLYDTCGLSDFDAVHTPAGRDLIREFVDACNKYGLMPMFYHTTLDWYNKDFNEKFDEYLEYLRKSVEILCKNYGKIGGLWFDGNWSKPDSDWKVDELYATIRKYQPEAMIINNTGLSDRGKIGNPEIDSVTFEQGIPTPMNREGMSKYVSAEMCHTLNEHWGIGYDDLCYKSPTELIKSLCDCRKVGANYLLNIGPEAQGKINNYQKELLGLLGRWMELFGEAIYNGRPCGVNGIGKNFALKSVDGENLYFFVYDLATRGDGNVTVGRKYRGVYAFGGVSEEITSIKWMDNNEELPFVQGQDMLAVNLTGHPYGTSYPVRVAKATIK